MEAVRKMTRKCIRVATLLAVAAAAVPTGSHAGTSPADIEVGRRIYMEGLLPGGEPLQGRRWDNVAVSGAQAACALCHRASGMGAVEGDIPASPVTGHALFGGDKVVANMDPRSGKAFNQAHDVYDDASLAQALRSGRHVDGRQMDVMMPRYELGEAEMKSLTAYLHQLSVEWSPGVTKETIRFATVITPDADPDRKAIFIDMIRKAVAQKNSSTAVASNPRMRRHMASAAEFVLGTERTWSIDIWELQGAPDTWAAQLDDFYRRQPVFALVSGLGAANWAPVDAFCDRQKVPCWFPSVDFPPTAAPRYSLYFSRGVTLEAAVLAGQLRRQGARAPKRLVQVFRDDAVGRGASRALAAALSGSGIVVEDRVLAGGDGAELKTALAGLGADAAVMFWLRPADIALLEKIPPGKATAYFSGQLGEPETGRFPATWKERLHIVYPYALPEARQANLAYFKFWLKRRNVQLVDEPLQSEIFFSLSFLTDTVTEMLDNLYRDYLIERAENMISRRESAKAEEEVRMSNASRLRRVPQRSAAMAAADGGDAATAGQDLTALQQAGAATGKREGTTVYPRLGLGPGQRFASKGAYIVRFADRGSDRLVAETDWIVP